MHIDREEFVAVAKVVIKHNKHLKGWSLTALVHQMEALAYRMTEPGYWATSGYMLTAYNHPIHGLAVKPSISHIIFN